MNIKKNSYLKLNYDISVVNLQKVVDFCEENDIEYKELYETDLEQQLSQLQQEKEDLIKWLEDEYMCFDNESDECIIARQILSKLKESDKDVS